MSSSALPMSVHYAATSFINYRQRCCDVLAAADAASPPTITSTATRYGNQYQLPYAVETNHMACEYYINPPATERVEKTEEIEKKTRRSNIRESLKRNMTFRHRVPEVVSYTVREPVE